MAETENADRGVIDMAVNFSQIVTVNEGSTYGFGTIPATWFEELFSMTRLGSSVSSWMNISSATIYATTEANANQLTDNNIVATVTFSGSGFLIEGIVTRLDDNGRKFSGKKYVAVKLPSAANNSKTIIVSFGITPADTVKIETGSGFQECFPMLYNGADFVPCLIERYDGTAFEECTHIVYEDN